MNIVFMILIFLERDFLFILIMKKINMKLLVTIRKSVHLIIESFY